jgi:hypothetical protein
MSLLYDLPTDKQTGTWAQTGGTVNAVYPLTNIDDDKPWNPTVFTVNPTSLTIDFATAKRVDVVSFIHVKFDAAAVIHVQMNATNTWATPTVDGTLVVVGPAEDSMPANPFIDLTAVSGYSTGGFRYLNIKIVSGQSSLLSFGNVRISGRKRTITGFTSTPRNRASGGGDAESHPVMERPTDAGAQLGYSRGTRARWVNGSIRCNDTGFSDLLTWTRSCLGRFKPSLLIPDSSVNEAYFVKWGASADYILQRQTLQTTPTSVHDVPVNWEEVGRGLAP